MPLLPRRLRRPKAVLQIQTEIEPTETESPPDETSGGDLCIRVELLPKEGFRIRRGRLELSLVTTRFSRTVLDGYMEHSTESLHSAIELCADTEARAGTRLFFSARVPLATTAAHEPGPGRLHWKAIVRFQPFGYREIRATKTLFPKSKTGTTEPVVDGSGFLPLYEFRSDSRPQSPG